MNKRNIIIQNINVGLDSNVWVFYVTILKIQKTCANKSKKCRCSKSVASCCMDKDLEIYDINSNLWRIIDVMTLDCDIESIEWSVFFK